MKTNGNWMPMPVCVCVELTSGTNGGSTMPASSRFQLIQLKNWCSFTSRAPYRPLRQPMRVFTVLDNNCWHNDLASSLNLREYFSNSSCLEMGWEAKIEQNWLVINWIEQFCVIWTNGHTFTLRSTSSRLTFSLRKRNGAWPSIISYNKQPKLNQSGENEYFSLSTTSGAMYPKQICIQNCISFCART